MLSQSDRYSDGFGIAKRSQIIADTETDSETDSETAAASATEGRTPYKNSPPIHFLVTFKSNRPVSDARTVAPSPRTSPDVLDLDRPC